MERLLVLHEDELLRALDELAEIVEIICAYIPPPPRLDGENLGSPPVSPRRRT